MLRLASLNLLHGRSPATGEVSEQVVAAAVRSLGADVLCLQEVDRGQPRSGGLDLTAVAAAAMGAVAWRFVPALVGTPGTWAPAVEGEGDGPAFGVALVSRLPVRSWHVLRLPPPRVPAVMPALLPRTGPDGPRLGGPKVTRDEQRVALAAVVETAAGPWTVCSAHLTYLQGWNVAQLRQVLHLLRPLPAPRYLAGDLNMAGRLPALASGWRPLVRGRTFPAWRPRLQIDHVLVEGAPPVLGSAVRELAVSDHRAVLVDLDDSPRPLH